jgi:hypothetical protein
MSKDLEMSLAHLKDKFEMIPERPDQTDMGMNSIELDEMFVRQMKQRAGIIK